MKKLIALFLSFCLFTVFSVPFASAAEYDTEVNSEAGAEVITPIVNDRVISMLEENNIDFLIVDGNIQLKEPSNINEANNLLNSQFQRNQSNNLFSLEPQTNPSAMGFEDIVDPSGVDIDGKSYPTAWTYMKNYDRTGSKKFDTATKIAFAALVTAWAKNITSTWQELSAIVVGAYGTYYFVNSNVENIYYFTKYYYRELGPGRFDGNGNFMGNYEIKKTIRTTKSASNTGGQLSTFYKKSTIIEPWF